MKSKPLWLLPVAGLGIGLAVSLLALVPIMWTKPRSSHQLEIAPVPRPAAPANPRPALPGKPAPTSAVKQPPRKNQLPEDEVNSYESEIDSLKEKAKINTNISREMGDLGSSAGNMDALEQASELARQATLMLRFSDCMRNQMDRVVPFYQGKATCAAAIPGVE